MEINFDALYKEHQEYCKNVEKCGNCGPFCTVCVFDFLKSKFPAPKPAAPEVFRFTFKCMACGEIWKQAETDKPVLCPRGCGSMERVKEAPPAARRATMDTSMNTENESFWVNRDAFKSRVGIT